MTCGILAFQGNLEEHERAIHTLGVESIRVLDVTDLKKVTHLIIPGGESTVISAFLDKTGIGSEIVRRVKEHSLSVLGTCAGAILLATEVVPNEKISLLGLIDITIERNSYGRQAQSFEASIILEPTQKKFNAVFIRAPKIMEVRGDAKILATHENNPILVQQNNVLVSTFHPEYLQHSFIHEYFLKQ
jgi:pyridoxal 5'-phosphate synthase pdxT subunit